MNNPGIAFLKVVALVGGALAGAILAHLVDEALRTRTEERANYDKTRYALGLAPVVPPTDPQKQSE